MSEVIYSLELMIPHSAIANTLVITVLGDDVLRNVPITPPPPQTKHPRFSRLEGRRYATKRNEG